MIPEPPLVTVLVSSYNYDRFVETAIFSVLNQTYRNLECIVVDDGSTDHTMSILSAIHDARLRVVYQQNSGQAAAWNTGFSLSRGQYIFFCDADDYFYPSKIQEIMSHRGGEFSLYHHDLDEVDEQGQSIDQASFGGFTSRTGCTLGQGDLRHVVTSEFGWHFAPSSGLMIPRAVAEGVFPIPNHFALCADVAVAYGATLAGPVKLVPVSLGAYRLHISNGYASSFHDSYRWPVEQFINVMQRYGYLKEAIRTNKFGCASSSRLTSPLMSQDMQISYLRHVEPALVVRAIGLLSIRFKQFCFGPASKITLLSNLWVDLVSVITWGSKRKKSFRAAMRRRGFSLMVIQARKDLGI